VEGHDKGKHLGDAFLGTADAQNAGGRLQGGRLTRWSGAGFTLANHRYRAAIG
jgi:hypothetical protein